MYLLGILRSLCFIFFASAIFLGAIVYYCFFENSEHERKMSFFTGLIGIGLLSTAIVLQTLHVGHKLGLWGL